MSASESIARRVNSMAGIIALPLGRAMIRGWRPESVFLVRQNRVFRQGLPMALVRTNELDGESVDGAFMALMRCLQPQVQVSKHTPQQ